MIIRNTFSQILLSLSFLSIIFSACQEEDNELQRKGSLQLGIERTIPTHAKIDVPNPSSIMLTIKDAEGNTINSLKKIPLIKVGDQFITEALEFVEGEFTIEDFIVLDDHDSTIYITPKLNSDFADMVEFPLPFTFSISGSKTSDLILEVIPANLGKAIQYGYTTISFNVVNPLEKGLVAYYPFDGNADDASENGLHAEVEGATLTADREGKVFSAYSFDGTNDKITGKTDNMGIAESLSISCWVKTTDHTMPHLVSKYDWKNDRGYTLRLIEGVPYLDGRDGSGQFIRCGDQSVMINDGEWHHLTATVEKNEWRIFVDGEIVHKVHTQTETVNFNTNFPLSIGYYYQGNEGDFRFLNGSIDEVRIYNRILTLYEISKLAGEFL